jgi:hypothetical protein
MMDDEMPDTDNMTRADILVRVAERLRANVNVIIGAIENGSIDLGFYALNNLYSETKPGALYANVLVLMLLDQAIEKGNTETEEILDVLNRLLNNKAKLADEFYGAMANYA